MSKQRKKVLSSIFIGSVVERYQDHPSMIRVNQLKNKLKQEKLQDKVFYQSVKQEIAANQ